MYEMEKINAKTQKPKSAKEALPQLERYILIFYCALVRLTVASMRALARFMLMLRAKARNFGLGSMLKYLRNSQMKPRSKAFFSMAHLF